MSGGGLALSIAMRARDEGGPLIRFLSLASPMINAHPDSYAVNQEYDPRTLNKSGVLDLWKYYAGEAPKPWNAYLDPIQGDYAGLPAVYTYAGELDPFRDDTIAMASKLWAQNVPTQLHIYPGCCHVFDAVAANTQISKYAVSEIICALQDGLRP